MSGPPKPEEWRWPPIRLRLARVLIDADVPLPGSEIGRALWTNPSNANKELVQLERAGLVTIHSPDPAEPLPPGRPSRQWALSEDQRAIAERAIAEGPEPQRLARAAAPAAVASPAPTETQAAADEDREAAAGSVALARPAPGQVRRGQELVIAGVARGGLGDVLTALANAESGARTAWAALCGEDLVFALDGEDPPAAAIDLLAILDAAHVPLRRATVARIWSGAELGLAAAATAQRRRQARTTPGT